MNFIERRKLIKPKEIVKESLLDKVLLRMNVISKIKQKECDMIIKRETKNIKKVPLFVKF
jgi:hypothetical protein